MFLLSGTKRKSNPYNLKDALMESSMHQGHENAKFNGTNLLSGQNIESDHGRVNEQALQEARLCFAVESPAEDIKELTDSFLLFRTGKYRRSDLCLISDTPILTNFLSTPF